MYGMMPYEVAYMIFKSKNFDELTTTELYDILRARCEIFMLEQDIRCQDMDGVDYHSRHCFLEENGRVVGYLRAFYADPERTTVQIGRALTLTHRQGHGRRLMQESIADIRKNLPCRKISLHSQKHAEGFYEKCGFHTVSDEFLEAGVVHVTMEMDL